MKLVILFSCLAIAAAQVPKACETPPVWHGIEVGKDYDSQFERRRTLHYDEPNERVHFIDYDKVNTTYETHIELFLHKQKEHYSVDLRTGQCTRSPLTEPFRPFSIPPTARFVGEFVLGSTAVAGAGAIVDVWSGLDMFRGGNFTVGVTNAGCVPIFFDHFTERYGYYHAQWYDIQLGIDIPTIFDVPRQCEEL
ncbi:mammalian ependymin-related protein 1-like [Corticium candelabrum]|uniref:mammalian ependymin-related protein 1-like n=1 Tax=Corticium candelabrum TaxID=121492 RepID=UPI002E252572|nr:mammalian ependymin-related protein 1-like [Corticium candelabrum]